MITSIDVELRKLNRSLAGVLALAAPCLIPIYTLVRVARWEGPLPWDATVTSGLAIWAFFMLPMSAIALTALVAQLEHGPRSWEHLHALPIARWRTYAAKLVCVLLLLAGMSALTLGLTVVGAWIGDRLASEGVLSGTLDLNALFLLLSKIYAASLLMVALQFWTALRFSSFVPAISLGIAGVFFATVATSAKEGIFFPWQMPINMLASESWRADTALALGAVGGAVACVIAIVHLARRETY